MHTDITLDDMIYTEDAASTNPEHGGFNEYYKGILPNGDILHMSHYGYYANRGWEWSVYTPEDFPIQCYQRNYLNNVYPTAEEALDDFLEYYKGRNWLTQSEWEAKNGPVYYRCLKCGWEGKSSEIGSKTVYEDYGDVSMSVCPGCGRVERFGEEFLVEIG